MRPIEILFLICSVLIVALIGLAPLFHWESAERRIRDECRLFYGPSGEAEVETCLHRMIPHPNNATLTIQ